MVGTGGLFTRLGLFLGEINAINIQRNTTLDSAVTAILGQYQSAQQEIVNGITNDAASYQQTPIGWLTALQNDAVNTVIAQVNDDTPLTSLTLTAALKVLISQMTSSVDTLTQPTVSQTVNTPGTNYGNAVFTASLLDTDGKTQYYVYAEALTATVTSDAGRGATEYQEPLQILGIPTVDNLSWLWPQGSGANISTNITDAAVDGIVTNGNWDNWTSNIPDDWVDLVAVPGTTLLRGTTPYRGTYNLEFIGNGSELTSIYQEVTLQPNTVYCINYWVKRTSISAGVLRIRLTNSANTTLTDDNGASLSSSVTILSGTSTSYTSKQFWFCTPKILPTVTRLFIELTTAATAAGVLDISMFALTPGIPLYTAGPYVAIFSGSIQSALNDYYTLSVANNGGTTSFVPALNRLLNITSLTGIKFPTQASGSVSNSLITI